MQAKSRVAVVLSPEDGEEGTIFLSTTETEQFTQTTPPQVSETTIKPRETKLDHVSAAIVCGMTAAFMAFIFGWVTEYISSAVENILLSLFMGLCIGVIAYALMTGDD
jgi:hypothetical protein